MTIAVLAIPSTETTRRTPLSAIDMVTSQAKGRPQPSTAPDANGRGKGRRTSSRLNTNQERNDESAKHGDKKRKAGFDEEDEEGFQFTRVAPKKARSSLDAAPKLNPSIENTAPQPSPKRGRPRKMRSDVGNDGAGDAEVPTPEVGVKKSTRSTRKAAPIEPEPEPEGVTRSTRKQTQAEAAPTRQHDQPEPAPGDKKRKKGRPAKSKPEERNGFVSPEPQTAKISLPMADTPVMQKNKEMRTKKSEKGNRRSSLGMRGRRASSLIDSGTSNALPHKEVDTADFYKHIASDLPEPRRMRQLLIWCATRAMGDRPSGSRSEDESARLAARVIQEELLKDFSTTSELSNWFGREEANPAAVVVKKPNPKNIQNTDKIKELEEQIQRLQQEKHDLNALLRPPSIPSIKPQKHPPTKDEHVPQPSQPESASNIPAWPSEPENIDSSLLGPSQQAILASMHSDHIQQRSDSKSQQEPSTTSSSTTSVPPMLPSTVSSRLSRITGSLAPTLDTFATGLHDIDLYRAMADTVSSRVLRICSERLEERDARNAMRRLAIEGTEDENQQLRSEMPKEDIGVILGALSRAER